MCFVFVFKKFWLFSLLRCLVGIGQSSFSCLAPTIIGDLFASKKRSNILTIYYLAIPFGIGLSFILGSKLSEAFGGWQWALRMTPPLSLVGALFIAFLVQEPERGSADGIILNANRTNILNEIIYLIKK